MRQNEMILEEENSKAPTRSGSVAGTSICQLLLMAGFLSVLFCFLSAPAGRAALTVEALVLIGLIYADEKFTKAGSWLWMVFLAFGAALMLVRFAGFRAGLLTWLNQWIQILNRRFNCFFAEFSGGSASALDRTQFLMFMVLAGVALIWYLAKQRNVLLLSLYVLLVLLCGSLLGLSVPVWGFCACVLGWLGVWCSSLFESSFKRLLVFLLPAAAAFAAFAAVTAAYQGSRGVTDFRGWTVDRFEAFRYGSDTLPKGDLTKASGLVGEPTSEALVVEADQPSQMYLRGFTGGSFQNNRWLPTSEAAYHQEAAGMIDWLSGNHFYSCMQYASYINNTGVTALTASRTLKVENRGADRRYLYLPYETVRFDSRKGAVCKDWEVDAKGFFGASSYSFDKLNGSVLAEQLQLLPLSNALPGAAVFSESEQVYRTFVYNNDCELSDTDRDAARRIFFEDQDWSQAAFGEIAGQIRLKLQEAVTYKEKPPVYSGKEDFLSWLMEKTKTGNSAYFATAAVLALRAEGIPARYVEGYHLSEADAAALSGKSKQISISKAHAHAWAEVYLDQAGWMPFETVPGFYFAEYTTKSVLDAPTTSINVANQDDEQHLNGSTADALTPKKEKTEAEKKEDLIRTSVHVIGITLFLAIFVWLLHLLIRAQRVVRRKYRAASEQKLEQVQQIRRTFERVNSCMKTGGILESADHPFQNERAISRQCGQELTVSYHHFVELVQKSVFGGIGLTPAELQTVKSFEERMEAEVYAYSPALKKWILKYYKALV